MASSDVRFRLAAGRVIRRASASFSLRPWLVTVPVCVLVLALALAACGGDDGAPAGENTNSPTADGGSGDGPSPSPAQSTSGSGSATIAGVDYEFPTARCITGSNPALVIGSGQAPDGLPFISFVNWFKNGSVVIENSVEVGIGTNAPYLFEDADRVYKIGNSVLGSTVDSIDFDTTGFDLTISGKFVDLKAPDAPPVEGTFSVSCD